MNTTIQNLNGEQPKPATDGFDTKKEIAQKLRKSTRTVEQWTRQGLIPCIKIGRSVLYSWPQVEAALREKFTINGGAR